MVRGNADLQGKFAQLTVPNPLSDEGDATQEGREDKTNMVYVIDGLLDLTLGVQPCPEFNLRMAACECIKSYFFKHSDIRRHFLSRAIEGHLADRDETGNILTILLNPSPRLATSDPYGIWFAAIIMFHLVYNDPTAKASAMAITEGDVSSGEEVVTSIQAITSHLISGLSRGDNPRVLVAYVILLLGWLFEDPDGVNDFLGEGSHVQGLIQAVTQPAEGVDEIVRGLCAMLLGVVYDFSTKDSPIPRATLQPILLARMGRDKYLDRLANLRAHPFIRDFEVTPQKLDGSSSGKLADVYFDDTFVEFLKDNYSRIARAIDRDPDLETPVMANGVEKGVSRELVDSLRAQLEEKESAIQDMQRALDSLRHELLQEQENSRAARGAASRDIAKLKDANDTLRREYEDGIRYSCPCRQAPRSIML